MMCIYYRLDSGSAVMTMSSTDIRWLVNKYHFAESDPFAWTYSG